VPFTISDISTGRNILPPRIVLPGREKIGKSTFAAGAPNPIFIPVKGETGLDFIDAPKFPPVQAFENAMEALTALDSDHEYKTVVLDSLSTFEPMICDYACREEKCASVAKLGGGYGHQEAVLIKHARTFLDWLDYLRDARGMGCILIAHIKTQPKTFNDPLADPYDTYRVECRESIFDAIKRWADAILFATTKIYTSKVGETGMGDGKKKINHATGAGERVIYTEARPAFPAGCRFPLPFELPLSYAAFDAEYQKAVNSAG
jgi:hypothetical protein